MYSMGIVLLETINYCIPTIILQPKENVNEDNLHSAQESLFIVSGLICDIMISKDMVFNLLISDRGMTFYIIPRKKDSLIKEKLFETSYLDLSGIIECNNINIYNKFTHKDFIDFCMKNVALDKNEYRDLKKAIVQRMNQEYTGEPK